MIGSIYQNLKAKLFYEYSKYKNKEPYAYNREVQDIVSQIRENSFAMIPNFYSEEECQILRDEIDTLIEKRRAEKNLWMDPFEADHRCFAAELDSEVIAKFHNDPFLLSVAENYFRGKIGNSNTLAAKIVYKKGNIGSGQGWHRDANHFQFKAIVYLCDVDIVNGPFQIIKGSHKLGRVLRDTVIMDAEPLKTRFSDKQVNRLIDRYPDDYKVLTARAGTLIFADVSSIHTGMPLSEGGYRYTLFNYYYPSYMLEPMRKMFQNIMKTQEYA
jgi:hypothetical protein